MDEREREKERESALAHFMSSAVMSTGPWIDDGDTSGGSSGRCADSHSCDAFVLCGICRAGEGGGGGG
jgi:hypothetical protein